MMGPEMGFQKLSKAAREARPKSTEWSQTHETQLKSDSGQGINRVLHSHNLKKSWCVGH